MDVAALHVEADVIALFQPVPVVSVVYVDETLDGKVEYFSAVYAAASNHNSLTNIFVKGPVMER